MIGVVLCVKNGEERWGKGGGLGHCRKGWGVGFTSSGWLLLGVERVLPPVEAPALQGTTFSFYSSTLTSRSFSSTSCLMSMGSSFTFCNTTLEDLYSVFILLRSKSLERGRPHLSESMSW